MIDFLTITYEEFSDKPDLGYESVDLYIDNTVIKFNTGDFCQDWIDMNEYVIVNKIDNVALSSRIGDFFNDGADKLYFEEGGLYYPRN